MRSLSPELPAAATRLLDVPADAALADVPTTPRVAVDRLDVPDPLTFAWDAHATTVSGARDAVVVAATVAAAARHLGYSEPAAGTPVVVLQRLFGHLHRAAIAGW